MEESSSRSFPGVFSVTQFAVHMRLGHFVESILSIGRENSGFCNGNLFQSCFLSTRSERDLPTRLLLTQFGVQRIKEL